MRSRTAYRIGGERVTVKPLVAISLLLMISLLFSPVTFAAEAERGRSRGWATTVEAAKKEGQLTVYYWGSPLVIDRGVFQKAYPEIKVTTVTGSGNQRMQRIFAERRGDKFILDVYIAGIATMALLNRAPHPNAAKLFINWFLSREGQALHQKLQAEAKAPADSLRVDIPKDYIPLADQWLMKPRRQV
jgi:ABC-type glycerol-3-phosphate transport system substrate-binding protein